MNSPTSVDPGVSRRAFLQTGAALAAAMALPRWSSGQAPSRPPQNVLFISIDDLNTHLGCYGNRIVQSPHIDRLASSGTTFTRAYSQFPSCMPSRFSFLSGWYPERTKAIDFTHGVRNAALGDAVYLGQHFRRNGYFTARLDKVFHIGTDDALSWDVSEEPQPDRLEYVFLARELQALGMEDRIVRRGRYDDAGGERGPFFVMDCEDEELFDGMITTRAIDLMTSKRRGDKPFFLAMGYRRPHLPWIAPRKYFDLYPYESIELPPPDPGTLDPYPEQRHREMIAHYYACVSFIDAQVGRLLRGLEDAGLAGNTTVMLFGDQGYCLGERNRWFGKGNTWDRSLHVPLIVRDPSQARAGQRRDEVVGLIDMYPTLVQTCGLPDPGTRLQGTSLAPLLTNGAAGARRDLAFSMWKPHTGEVERSVRSGRYRYSETVTGTPLFLHDYDNDPYEHRNLVDDPSHAAIRDELAAAVREDRS